MTNFNQPFQLARNTCGMYLNLDYCLEENDGWQGRRMALHKADGLSKFSPNFKGLVVQSRFLSGYGRLAVSSFTQSCLAALIFFKAKKSRFLYKVK